MDRQWEINKLMTHLFNARKAGLSSKATFFFNGFGTLWGSVKPHMPPIPHKSTHSNLMCGLGGVRWFACYHTFPDFRKSDTSSNLKSRFNAHLCSELAEKSIFLTLVPHESTFLV
jgi:hypothetical protein